MNPQDTPNTSPENGAPAQSSANLPPQAPTQNTPVVQAEPIQSFNSMALSKSSWNPSRRALIIGSLIICVILIAVGVLVINILKPKPVEREAASTGASTSSTRHVDDTAQQSSSAASAYASNDEERKGELSTLADQLNNYYDRHGQYPTLSNMNDPAFRKTNFPVLKEADFKDPAGTKATFIDGTARDKKYGYKAGKVGVPCDGTKSTCQSVLLTAILDEQVSTQTSSTGSSDLYFINVSKGTVTSSLD